MMWLAIGVLLILLTSEIIYEVRDDRKHQFLAKLMDCEYIKFTHGKGFYVPLHRNEEGKIEKWL